MYELKDVHGITITKSDEYTDSVKIAINMNGYQTTTVSLNRSDFEALIAQGLGYLGVGTEMFNLSSWLESKANPRNR